MKNFTFVIIDDNHNNGLKTRAVAGSFQNLTFLASASSYDEGIDCVLEHVPDIVFLEIDPQDKDSNLSLHLINELHRYLTVVPKIIVTTQNDSLCLNAFKYGVFDYFIHPMETKELRKTLFRLDKELGNKSVSFPSQIKSDATEIPVIEDVITSNEENQETLEIDLVLDEVIENEFVEDVIESQNTIADDKEVTFLQTQNTPEKPLIICVKSYGDYRYIEAKDICYLQADNNSTDIHLNSGEMITAFKTLKHFEGVMTYPFVRIHNSYIANVDYISRIHTGNAVCHIKNTTTKLPFSKSYKENVDAIITTIAAGNYLEI